MNPMELRVENSFAIELAKSSRPFQWWVDMVVLFCSFKTNRKFAQKNRIWPCSLFCSFCVRKLEQLFAQFAHNSHNPNKIRTVYKIRTNSHNSHNSHNWNKRTKPSFSSSLSQPVRKALSPSLKPMCNALYSVNERRD